MVYKYALVNPIIIGNLNTTVDAENSSVAAKEIYNLISPHFSNVQTKFLFSIQKIAENSKSNELLGGGDAQYYHFKVKEVQKGSGEVVFTISNYSDKVNNLHLSKTIKNVINKINNDASLTESEDNMSDFSGGKKPKKAKRPLTENNKHKETDDSDTFNNLYNELNDEENDLFPKKKKSLYAPAYTPYPYVSPFYLPTITDPITYYWYSDIYLDTSRLYLPSFTYGLFPRLIIDRGDSDLNIGTLSLGP
jgi:hypothetical protein